jgi:hypothetical protein
MGEELEEGLLHSPPAVEQTATADLPPFTVWERRRCLCCRTAYVPAIDRTFIADWEVHPVMPFLVTFLIIGSFVTFVLVGIPTFPLIEQYILYPFISLAAVIFLWAYWRVLAAGPGYFPFYWDWARQNAYPKNPDDPWEIAGVHNSQQEQVTWIQIANRPPRSMFSSTARRYVLRPDHLCLWTASWIGKMNHKFFLLFNIYGILYCASVGAYAMRFAIAVFRERQITVWAVLFGLFGLAGVAFIIMTARFCLNSLKFGVQNLTNWEYWNQIDNATFDHGSAIANLADIMGPPGLAWLCPLNPWPNASMDTIIGSYISYDDIPR